MLIPNWIYDDALLWSEEKIIDNKFTDIINYLIKNEIITIPENQSNIIEVKKIPSWIKDVTGWCLVLSFQIKLSIL